MKEMMSLIKKTTSKLPTSSKLPTTNQTMRKRRRGKKGARNTMTHLFANIAERNILPNQKKSVGN
jgi:hypothetical protein